MSLGGWGWTDVRARGRLFFSLAWRPTYTKKIKIQNLIIGRLIYFLGGQNFCLSLFCLDIDLS